MCTRDWSSDVCSSDLRCRPWAVRRERPDRGSSPARAPHGPKTADRKSGGEGKRVDFGGRRIIKKKDGIGCVPVTGVQTCALPILGVALGQFGGKDRTGDLPRLGRLTGRKQ